MKNPLKNKARSFYLGFAVGCAVLVFGFVARANAASNSRASATSGDNSATAFEPTDSAGNRASADESSYHATMSGMSTGSSDSTAGSSMTGSTYSDSTSNLANSVTRNPPGNRVIKDDATGTSSGTSSGTTSGPATGANSSEDGPVPAKRP